MIKDVYTTTEAAKICLLSSRTISKLFDQGLIKGYRVPNSRDRRIPRANLIEFMKANGIDQFQLLEKYESEPEKK